MMERRQMLMRLNSLEEATVTGNPVTFSTTVARPLVHSVIGMEPVQAGNGDPAPDNVRPITGWTGCKVTRTGRNLLNPNLQIDATATTLVDMFSAYIQSGVYGKGYYNGSAIVSNAQYVTTFTSVKAGVTYTITNSVDTFSRVCFLDDIGNVITISGGWPTTYTHTVSDGEKYLCACFKTADYDRVMLNVGSTSSSYAPYSGESVEVTFPAEAGTVYGGTVDLATGTLTVDRAMVDNLAAMVWNYHNSLAVFYAELAIQMQNTNADTNDISDVFTQLKGTGFASLGNNQFLVEGSGIRLAIKHTDSTDVTQFKSFLTAQNPMLVLRLAEPVIYHLTPQQITALIGDNVLWSNTNADCTVTYLKKK